MFLCCCTSEFGARLDQCGVLPYLKGANCQYWLSYWDRLGRLQPTKLLVKLLKHFLRKSCFGLIVDPFLREAGSTGSWEMRKWMEVKTINRSEGCEDCIKDDWKQCQNHLDTFAYVLRKIMRLPEPQESGVKRHHFTIGCVTSRCLLTGEVIE